MFLVQLEKTLWSNQPSKKIFFIKKCIFSKPIKIKDIFIKYDCSYRNVAIDFNFIS